MPRLVGYIANRPDLGSRVVASLHEQLSTTHKRGQPRGWGVGFAQSGELLLKRRPLDESPCLSMHQMLGEVRSDLVLAHVRHATVGTFRTENTHPFRYQQWMFADTGTVSPFESLRDRIQAALPDFILRSLRGETDSELIFGLFLSFLHEAGNLNIHSNHPRDAFSALKSTFGMLDRLTADEGMPPSALNLMLATPEHLMAAHRGAPMAYRIFRGRDDFAALMQDDEPSAMRAHDLDPCRLVLIASDFDGDGLPDGWTPVMTGSFVAFDRTATLTQTPTPTEAERSGA